MPDPTDDLNTILRYFTEMSRKRVSAVVMGTADWERIERLVKASGVGFYPGSENLTPAIMGVGIYLWDEMDLVARADALRCIDAGKWEAYGTLRARLEGQRVRSVFDEPPGGWTAAKERIIAFFAGPTEDELAAMPTQEVGALLREEGIDPDALKARMHERFAEIREVEGQSE